MEEIVVIGGGGHAKVIIEILQAAGWSVKGFCDPSWPAGECFGDVPCLGDDSVLPEVFSKGVRHAIVALGDNNLRSRIAHKVCSQGFILGNAIHPSAQISPSVTLGRGIAIMAGAVINAATVIGDNSVINTGATVDHDCRIGQGTHIAPGSHLAGFVTVGERVLIGVGSVVGRGRPIFIGDGAIVGSGSVVIRDVPSSLTVVGNPASALDSLIADSGN